MKNRQSNAKGCRVATAVFLGFVMAGCGAAPDGDSDTISVADPIGSDEQPLASGIDFSPTDVLPKYAVTLMMAEPWPPHNPTPECTGTIVGERWILTAAHCLISPGDEIRFHAGNDYSGDVLHVSRVVRPPNVTPSDFYIEVPGTNYRWREDLMLVRTDSPISLSKYRVAAILPAYPPVGTQGYLVGSSKSTGTTGRLQYVAARLNAVGILEAGNSIFVGKTNIFGNVAADHGDSGGGFLVWEGGQFVLRGVISSDSALNSAGLGCTSTFGVNYPWLVTCLAYPDACTQTIP